MKMKAVKIIAIMLIMSLSFILISSCQSNDGNASNDSNTDNNINNPNQVDIDEEIQEQEEERLYPDLEPVDFENYEFRFLTRTINDIDWAEWDHRDLYAEEETGDIINDAVYARNRKIEEKYNITITETIVADFGGTVRNTVRAGDDVYDVVLPHLVEVMSLAQDGNFVNMFNVPHIDLEKPWWDQGGIRDLSVGNRLFVLQGDLLIMDNDAMEAMIFNKELLRDTGLESPYEIVKRGEWTFDKLIEMSRGVSRDLNGDGVMFIRDDRFGCILQSDTDLSFLVSGGEKIVSKDANDYPMITFGSERSFRIMEKVSELMLDDDNVVQLHRYYGQFGIYDEQVKMMEEDRALFSWIRMRIVERLRAMETDFGIIPLPKLDTNQPNYITHNNPHTGAAIAIPVTASNLERTGMILEDLSAESRYTLRPAYYEVNLRGKFVRDDDSQEMLDIILNNTAHDIGYIYDFGGFAMSIIHYGRDRRADYASAFERMQERMLRDIERMIERYESFDD